MPYVTSIERMGIEKGIQQGMQQGMFEFGKETVIDILEMRFGTVPLSIMKKIDQIDDTNMLRLIRRQALKEESLESFTDSLKISLS